MALRNQPYIPLYVQDFMTDEKLAECSAESTGVYIRIMCVMHKSEEYGTITLHSRNERTGNICYDFARKLLHYLPYDIETINRGLQELIDNGVVCIDGDTLSQKRMVRDANVSAARAAAGFAGGKSKAERSKLPSKTLAKHIAKIVANTEYETATVIETNNEPSNVGFISESEMNTLADGLQSVFDAAHHAGFPDNAATMDALNLLTADYGAEAVMRAIGGCVDQSVIKLSYLKGILKSDPTGGGKERPKQEEPAFSMPRSFDG